MSSTVIKDVTRALQTLLLSQLSTISSSAQVSLLAPGIQMPTGLGVNLYLYRVLESPFTKNQPWPGDKLTAPAVTPALGLELSYLLTPFAPNPDPTSASGDDAHTMLGAAMMAFHENAVLNNTHILGFDADAVLPATVLNSFEQVKIRLATTSLEELSKIWATINQPYRLSVAYEVSLVEITPTPPPRVNGGIVLNTNVNVVQFHPPRVDALNPPVGALAQVSLSGAIAGNPLTITGAFFSFPGQTPAVQIGGQPVILNITPTPTDSSLTVTLPTSLDAGPNENVQVILNSLSGVPLTFTVSPWLTSIDPIRTALPGIPGPSSPPTSPPVTSPPLTGPILLLQGQGFTTNPQAVRFDGPGGTTNVTSFVGTVTNQQAAITIPTTLANGIYQVRLVLAAPGNNVSNARTLQVIPLISSVSVAVVTAAGNQVHQLTIQGARLNGTDVRVLIDGLSHQIPANTNASQLVLQLGRLLDPGPHTLSVVIDGSASHDFAITV